MQRLLASRRRNFLSRNLGDLEINLYTMAQLHEQKNEVKQLPNQTIRKKATVKAKLSVIKCSGCGAEITVVPNVKLMSKVIESHVDYHRSKLKNPLKAETEADQVRDDLIGQIFEVASEK